MKEDSQGGEIILFPNPASDILNIKMPAAAENASALIQVYNYLGSGIYTSVSSETVNSVSARIDVSNFQKGIYMLVVSFGAERITKSFVVK